MENAQNNVWQPVHSKCMLVLLLSLQEESSCDTGGKKRTAGLCERLMAIVAPIYIIPFSMPSAMCLCNSSYKEIESVFPPYIWAGL